MIFNFNTIQEKYDVIVIGSGPAGLNATLNLQKKGPDSLSIAILDKRDPWREPVACAEAVHKGGLYELLDVEADWIRSTVDGVYLVAPNGVKIRYDQKNSGVILDRALMHYNLAQRCQEGGAHCQYRSLVKKVHPLKNGLRQVDVIIEGEKRTLYAKAVIDASGAGPSITNEKNILESHFDVEPAVFALVKGIDCDQNFIEMYFGETYAPGGYAWVFPRDGEWVNVGIVVGREYLKSHPPRQMFKKFIARFGPDSEIQPLHGGPISCGQPKGPIANNGLFKTGDSADFVNPISRGGILEAMYGGQISADGILTYLKTPEADHSKTYSSYHKLWMDYKGSDHEKLAQAKKAFGEIPDKILDKAANKLSKLPPEKRTMFRIFWATLTSSPLILWKMRSLI